jgi:hypothetical protein
MGHEGLTGFLLNNLSLLIAMGMAVTAVVIVVAIVLAVFEARRSKIGPGNGQQDMIQELSRTVQDLRKTIEDLERQTVESHQDLAKQVKEIHKEVRTVRKEFDAVRREVHHLLNMERMNSSGTYDTGGPTEERTEEKRESSEEKQKEEPDRETDKFWHNAKDTAEYLIPVWGLWKFIKKRREKKRTGSR